MALSGSKQAMSGDANIESANSKTASLPTDLTKHSVSSCGPDRNSHIHRPYSRHTSLQALQLWAVVRNCFLMAEMSPPLATTANFGGFHLHLSIRSFEIVPVRPDISSCATIPPFVRSRNKTVNRQSAQLRRTDLIVSVRARTKNAPISCLNADFAGMQLFPAGNDRVCGPVDFAFRCRHSDRESDGSHCPFWTRIDCRQHSTYSMFRRMARRSQRCCYVGFNDLKQLACCGPREGNVQSIW